jgi:hypothetical protein
MLGVLRQLATGKSLLPQQASSSFTFTSQGTKHL